MPIPDYQTLMRPVLAAFRQGPRKVQDILPELIAEFSLTREEAEELIPSGK